MKIKEGHKYYVGGNNDYRTRLLTAFEKVFKELEDLGVARHFSESLLIWGKEFADSVVLESKDRKVATLEDFEAIFGETRDLTEQEKKVDELARKHEAIVYNVLSYDPPKIKILAKKGDGTLKETPIKLSLREKFSDKNKPPVAGPQKQTTLL